MKHYFIALACLVGFTSCNSTSYVNLVDYFGGVDGGDGLAYYVVNYTDETGNPVTDHIVDFEIIDKQTLKAYVYGNNPDKFDSYLIHGSYQIVTTF